MLGNNCSNKSVEYIESKLSHEFVTSITYFFVKIIKN